MTTGGNSLHVCSAPDFSVEITSRRSDEVKLVGIGFDAFNNHVTERFPSVKNISIVVYLGLPCLFSNNSGLGGKQLLEANEKHCFERREALGKRMKKEKDQKAVLLKKSRNLDSCPEEQPEEKCSTFACSQCLNQQHYQVLTEGPLLCLHKYKRQPKAGRYDSMELDLCTHYELVSKHLLFTSLENNLKFNILAADTLEKDLWVAMDSTMKTSVDMHNAKILVPSSGMSDAAD
ncbi:hypothetical protein llap_8223 [Limosa lapponica baueri]|uniref:Uncharacterized protein n=1 Tax=Limosa lapponica baueri TaxID=1758121 RepID=A0A2I0U666_LIMLA|nr:hypothetical protein llap_8223 [Limosa lapponica baueri]